MTHFFLVKSFMNYDAIAIRLKDDLRYKYTEHIGFDDDFIASESDVFYEKNMKIANITVSAEWFWRVL